VKPRKGGNLGERETWELEKFGSERNLGAGVIWEGVKSGAG